jgi:hypothetical protein
MNYEVQHRSLNEPKCTSVYIALKSARQVADSVCFVGPSAQESSKTVIHILDCKSKRTVNKDYMCVARVAYLSI